ncbi:hypothetical protein EMCG_03764 [[Emmonsia] crescens]|uniref:Fungal-type protein kinase domain-containing protein n=1 Tax=[Emmonsia] crescens TaxID=73230 RepID=A0A0G2HVE2_9EURO|nr:hypothetical protein EMCG_03764 [Emmonsia crescens UAMH 3008]
MNTNYEHRDITQISIWPEFSYDVIMQQYGTELSAYQIMPDPMLTSPPQAIRDEPLFHARFCEYILSQICRALCEGFKQLGLQLFSHQLTPVAFDDGTATDLVFNYKPDMAFIDVNSSIGERKNRCPGDLKAKEYRQVLSQVNFYMKQNDARYSFIITDTELVPVKRVSENGHLTIVTAISSTQRGPGQLIILLGLWYLGMLAASSNWEL